MSVASLRIFGDALVPSDVTARIGATPTWSYQKGDVKVTRSGRELVRKNGMWLLESSDKEPEDLNSQVVELLACLTKDIAAWKAHSEHQLAQQQGRTTFYRDFRLRIAVVESESSPFAKR